MLPSRPPTIAHLATLAGRGDAIALGALACEVQAKLEGHARRALSRHRATGLDADDVAEEVVAEVQAFLAGAGGRPGWRRFREGRAARGALDAWLYGIVRNKVRKRVRDARRRTLLLGGAGDCALGASPPVDPERAFDAARALRLAHGLPTRERAALALWLEDATSREIADRLRFASPHAVDCCLARGKQRLRKMMRDPELPVAA